MRFLLISFLSIATLSSCALKTTEGLRIAPLTTTAIVNPYFANEATDYVYKAKIEVYGRYFGGILIVKKLSKNIHRVVFTTEFGSKVFDFLYEGDTFTLNFIVEDLNKKILVNTLRQDFKLLISENSKVSEQFVSDSHSVYKSEGGKRDAYYFFNSAENRLERIINASKRKEKFEIVFYSEAKEIAQQITIQHHNIKLFIDLDYIKND